MSQLHLMDSSDIKPRADGDFCLHLSSHEKKPLMCLFLFQTLLRFAMTPRYVNAIQTFQ